MTENEKIELFDKWYDENYDEWAEGEEGIALREELEQAFKGGIAELEKENAELNKLRCCENCKNVNLQLHWRESEEVDKRRQFVCGTCGNRKHWEYLGKTVGITETQQLTKAKEIIKTFLGFAEAFGYSPSMDKFITEAEQFISEVEKCGQ